MLTFRSRILINLFATLGAKSAFMTLYIVNKLQLLSFDITAIPFKCEGMLKLM